MTTQTDEPLQGVTVIVKGTTRGINWFKEVLDRTSFQIRHNLSLREGSKKVNYFTSLGLTQREGIVKTDNSTDVNQYNFRTNLDIYPIERLKFSLDASGRFDNNKYIATSTSNITLNVARGLPADIPFVDGKPRTFDSTTDGGGNPFAYIQEEAGYNNIENTLFNSKLGKDR